MHARTTVFTHTHTANTRVRQPRKRGFFLPCRNFLRSPQTNSVLVGFHVPFLKTLDSALSRFIPGEMKKIGGGCENKACYSQLVSSSTSGSRRLCEPKNKTRSLHGHAKNFETAFCPGICEEPAPKQAFLSRVNEWDGYSAPVFAAEPPGPAKRQLARVVFGLGFPQKRGHTKNSFYHKYDNDPETFSSTLTLLLPCPPPFALRFRS